MTEALESAGCVAIPNILAAREIAVSSAALDRLCIRGAGSRNLLGVPWCRALIARVKARLSDAGTLPRGLVVVQCTLFEKTPRRNWLVAIHQDLAIPVRDCVDHPALGAWSLKEGGHFVQAPTELLEKMLAVRIHLDDCGPENGPLRVVAGSHRYGRLSDTRARRMRAALEEVACLAKRGDALLMRPLLLHASSKAAVPSRRRVLHVLFGPASLPYGLEWSRSA